MEAKHIQVGRTGEEIARRFLQSKGYKIIEQNYRTKYAEIDIVAKKGKTVVFVEVRTKTNEQFGTPEETFNYKKMQKLQKNAAAYISRMCWKGLYQIDAICVLLDGNGNLQRIDHYENITS